MWLQNFSEEVLERMEADRKQVRLVYYCVHVCVQTHTHTGVAGIVNQL